MTTKHNTFNHLLVVTEHFYPSSGATAQLMTDLVDDLVRNGRQVTVITASPGRLDKPYRIIRTSTTENCSNHIISKVLKGIYFFLGSLLFILRHIPVGTKTLIVSNPPFIVLLGVIVNFFKSIPYYFLFQDIFPRSAALAGLIPGRGPIFALWRLIINNGIKNSTHTIVLSDSMLKRCCREFPSTNRIVSIPNWSVIPASPTERNNSFARLHHLCTSLVIQYSGNYGRLHDILTILEGARLLSSTSNIKFVFIGSGAKEKQITTYKSKYNLNNITLLPFQPRTELAKSLAACDISIVSLIPGSEDTVAPSKLYGILASSRPILLIASKSCELAQLINQWNCGIVISPGDVLSLSQSLAYFSQHPEELVTMGSNSLRLYKTLYSRSRSIELYSKTLSISS